MLNSSAKLLQSQHVVEITPASCGYRTSPSRIEMIAACNTGGRLLDLMRCHKRQWPVSQGKVTSTIDNFRKCTVESGVESMSRKLSAQKQSLRRLYIFHELVNKGEPGVDSSHSTECDKTLDSINCLRLLHEQRTTSGCNDTIPPFSRSPVAQYWVVAKQARIDATD